MGFRAPGKRFRQPELSFYNKENPVHRPRAMIRSLCILLVCVVSALAQPNEFRKSLCRVNNTAQEFNYRVPWLPGAMSGGSGTGWVVAKDRIMTNAHVVSNARLLTVEKESDPKKYVATVEHIAHDCDLAILKVEDPAFWKDTKVLSIGGVPEIESTVSVYGYPIGGDRLSVTQGVVSRIDFRPYAHSVMDSHLTIQIDAAINPGNSGGPVVQNGTVVGVAFQGFSGDVAQNVGYMIPTPVVKHFLKDVEDGKYDRYMDLAIGTFPLQNPTHRKALGLVDDGIGVVVTEVGAASVAHGKVQVGDVLVAVDGLPIESDGMVVLEGERVLMAEVAERKFKGDIVKFDLLRKGKPERVEVLFTEAWPYIYQATSYDPPRYVVFGGLLFQPMNRNLLMTYGFSNPRITYIYQNFITDELYKERDEVLILSSLLPDTINTYLDEFREGIVEKVNGQPIRNLAALAAAFAEKPDQYVIEFEGIGRPLVLQRSDVEGARDRIRKRYNVLREQYLGETAPARTAQN
jgi:S1-C subfamily serine protease